MARLEPAEEIVVPTTVLGELYACFRLGFRQKANIQELHDFLERPGVKVAPIDDAVARRYGDIVAALRNIGKPMPTNDIWIAAVTLEHNGELLTRDEHFQEVLSVT